MKIIPVGKALKINPCIPRYWPGFKNGYNN